MLPRSHLAELVRGLQQHSQSCVVCLIVLFLVSTARANSALPPPTIVISVYYMVPCKKVLQFTLWALVTNMTRSRSTC